MIQWNLFMERNWNHVWENIEIFKPDWIELLKKYWLEKNWELLSSEILKTLNCWEPTNRKTETELRITNSSVKTNLSLI
jgi:hypothetical protein